MAFNRNNLLSKIFNNYSEDRIIKSKDLKDKILPDLISLANNNSVQTVSGVTVGTYGNSTNVPQIRVNAFGNITFAQNIPIVSGVSAVSATSPITSSGGSTPIISTSMSTNKLIGRGTGGSGVMEQITLGIGLSLTGTTLNVSTSLQTLAQVLNSGRNADATGTIKDNTSVNSIDINSRLLFDSSGVLSIDYNSRQFISEGNQVTIDYSGIRTLYDQTDSATLLWDSRELIGGTWTSIVSHTTPILKITGSSSGTISIQGKAVAGTYTLTLPDNDGSASQFLQTDGSGILSWASASSVTPAALTKTDDTNVTITLGGTPTTALLQATSIMLGWTGTLSDTRLSTTAVSAASYGSSTQTGTFTVSATGRLTAAANVTITPAASSITGGAALTKTDDTNVTLTLGGAPTTSLLTAASLTLGWTGQLSLARGGSAANLTASNGGIVYSTASAMAILAGTATANKMLLSGASTTPAWSTSTIPSSAGSAGKILRSDGTNYVSTTITYPNSSISTGSFLYVSASNVFSVTNVLVYDGTTISFNAPAVISELADSFGVDCIDTGLRVLLANDGITQTLKWDSTTLQLTGNWTNTGSFIVGTGALATNATDGFLYIPSCAGAPTGTPTTHTGTVPMVYDSTNDRIYIYRGGWKKTVALT